MKRVWYPLLALTSALVWLVGTVLLHPSSALAPAIESPSSQPPLLSDFQSVDELYQLRDRLREQLQESRFSESTHLLGTLQAVEIRIQVEETAQNLWNQALRSATRADHLEKSTTDLSIETLKNIHDLWQQAVDSLEEIPELSLVSNSVPDKLVAYQERLKTASYEYDTARSDFLVEIAQQTGLPLEDIHITVCHLDGDCRRLNGNVLPASPASLIKVPIAIALMQKVTTETISLDTKILVSHGNYTEDASDIWVGTEYPLRKLLMRMINQSSNIATNQLIDYVGRDYINQVMRDRGYTSTFVDYKLVGEYTYPEDAGSSPNTMSTDDLTEMMRQIFRFSHPGDDILMDALASQYDTVLGYDGLRGTTAIWMGEKTGQNSKALGTTFGFQIKGELYIASIVLDYSADEYVMRQCVKGIAQHIMDNGEL
jgi:beta-lactamase class A